MVVASERGGFGGGKATIRLEVVALQEGIASFVSLGELGQNGWWLVMNLSASRALLRA